jgi:hypothetical protein
VLEDSASVGGGNNSNGTAVTAVQLAAITGILNVDPANEAAYQAAIAAETGFSNPPTALELQSIITSVNAAATASETALAEVLEDSDSVGGGNNSNGTAVTAVQLAAITGILNVDLANEAAYQAAIAAETGFSNPPTALELQAIITSVNINVASSIAALNEVLEDSASTGGSSNANLTAVTFSELSAIMGLTDLLLVNEAAYQAAILSETGFSNPPTVIQVQAIIDNVNAFVLSSDEIILENIILYPNPTSDQFIIKGVNVEKIIMYNILGANILEIINTNIVDVSNLEVGVYIAKINTDKGKATVRVVIK